MSNPLILASTSVKRDHAYGSALSEHMPRQDYIEVARLLDADIMGPDLCQASWYNALRQVERRLKLNISESWVASRQLARHSLVLSTSEKVAIPLAAIMKAAGSPIPHVVIAHRLSSSSKAALFRAWPLQHSFSHLICVCQAQADYAVNDLGIPVSRVNFVHDKVDRHFFQPQNGQTGRYILSVGQEQRDYRTLLKAIKGTDVELIMVASSRWSDRQMEVQINGAQNVTVVSHISYRELRALYDGARMVVAPLFDVSYAAGVNSVLEAMAMAKPLVLSRTAGIQDYVVDDETGVFVSAGDPLMLRDAILQLWDQPGKRERLGTNARQMVDEQMNLENYVQQVAQIALGASQRAELAEPLPGYCD